MAAVVPGASDLLSPLPALLAAPALMLSGWRPSYYAVVLLPCLLFAIWNPQLFRGEGRIPKRTYVLFAVMTILNLLYFSSNWDLGVKYHPGPRLTGLLFCINLASAAFLGIAFRRTWGSPTSFGKSLLLHWLLFSWLFWYAFPWLGEMI